MSSQRLLCISYDFAPKTSPTAIRAEALVRRLAERWDVTLFTGTPDAVAPPGVNVVTHAFPRGERLMATAHRLKLGKLLELGAWPDEQVLWSFHAIRALRRLVSTARPEAILVFMMPFSTALLGVAARRWSDAGLVLNFDDSLTCLDMGATHPTRLHFTASALLERKLIRTAERAVYVSRRNLERVADGLPAEIAERLHLVRYGADISAPAQRPAAMNGTEPSLRIVYAGGMSGWYAFPEMRGEPTPGRRAYRRMMEAGRHVISRVDERSSSPVFLGLAIQEVLRSRPEWKGRIGVDVYTSPPPGGVVQRLLRAHGIEDLVRIHEPLPHEQVMQRVHGADTLFMALPDRPDGSAGGRISAKTYEYLATSRPIIAALPKGENRDYLEGWPGVWLVPPTGVSEMARAITELAQTQLDRATTLAFDRTYRAGELSYDARAAEMDALLCDAAAAAR
jgi:hypothetical protein